MVITEPIQMRPKRIPVKVGFYDIIRTIGKGNFASVKLARHQVTKTEVAIKIIEKRRLNESNLKKIYREIQILKLLRHQHIIKLYEVIETKTTIYLVCEYASHGEVFDYITKEKRIPEERVQKMFYQIFTAIEYCHKNNVVHRDLKAENLLLDSNDNVKLADFGFGNFFQSGQHLNTWCGSPPYAAPEVFEGKLYEGPQLDIWSLGIVLYVLVCGSFPFDGSNLSTLKSRVLAGRFRIPYWMSQDCENLIRRMLVVNPKNRLTIAQIKKHRWMQASVPKSDVMPISEPPVLRRDNQLSEFNDPILKFIQSLGLSKPATIKSLRNSTYDSLYAIYHLLVDSWKRHRYSLPLETRYPCDAGKRRPSSTSEQYIVTQQYTSNGASFPDFHNNYHLRDSKRFFDHLQNLPAVAVNQTVTSTRPEWMSDHRKQSNPINVVEDMENDFPAVQRDLAFDALHMTHPSPKPASFLKSVKTVSPAKTCRTTFLRQPWSFTAGMNLLAGCQGNLASEGPPSSGSGDVSTVTLSGEKRLSALQGTNTNPHGRHKFGMPDIEDTSLHHLAPGGDALHQSLVVTSNHHAGSLPGSTSNSLAGERNSFSSSSEISNYVNHAQHVTNNVTPRLVLSLCTRDNNDALPQQESQSTLTENQRQLLDISPTGFREGRRASDGLLLLGEDQLGENLRNLARTNCGMTTTQDNEDKEVLTAIAKTIEPQHSTQNLPVQDNKLGIMTSHSSHHLMQAFPNDVITFQPYTSPHKRRDFYASHDIISGRSGSYSGDSNLTVHAQQVPTSPLQMHQQTHGQGEKANSFQWSSWKTVNASNTSDSTSESRNHRVPLLMRTQASTFVVASDDSVSSNSSVDQAKRQSSFPNADALTVRQWIGQQSLVQQLQQRRLNRRLKAAQNKMQSAMMCPIPFSDLEQLRINFDGSIQYSSV